MGQLKGTEDGAKMWGPLKQCPAAQNLVGTSLCSDSRAKEELVRMDQMDVNHQKPLTQRVRFNSTGMIKKPEGNTF